jgi:endonuclease YncB( thermonuclease family)
MVNIFFRTIGAAFLLLVLSFSVWADFTGKVVKISDGDTITVLDHYKVQHRVRLTGIDAPERKQAFGSRSRQSLGKLVFSKTVTVKTNKRDRYGRVLGKVLINGIDINKEQIRRGMAWHGYLRDQAVADRIAYANIEKEARKKQRGLWADPNPLPPWKWRRLKKKL